MTLALIPHLPRQPKLVWEPACGDGAILGVLLANHIKATGTDLLGGHDFLARTLLPLGVDSIITNPPFNEGPQFVRHALAPLEAQRGFVAMLFRTDSDQAKSRADNFDHPAFAKKLCLRSRIVWFDRADGKKAAPSVNHAWWIFDWQHRGPPTIVYSELPRHCAPVLERERPQTKTAHGQRRT